jgi:hypothetical protein
MEQTYCKNCGHESHCEGVLHREKKRCCWDRLFVNGALRCVRFAVVRSAMHRTKQEIEAIINSETTQNLISIRDDLWSGEKTRQQIEDELREALEEGNDEE